MKKKGPLYKPNSLTLFRAMDKHSVDVVPVITPQVTMGPLSDFRKALKFKKCDDLQYQVLANFCRRLKEQARKFKARTAGDSRLKTASLTGILSAACEHEPTSEGYFSILADELPNQCCTQAVETMTVDNKTLYVPVEQVLLQCINENT